MRKKNISCLISIISFIFIFTGYFSLFLQDQNFFVEGEKEDVLKDLIPKKSSPSVKWNFPLGEDIMDTAISFDGNYIVAGTTSPNSKIFLFESLNSVPLWNYTTGASVESVAISSDGNYIVAGTDSPDCNIYLFNNSNSIPLWNYTTGGNIGSIAISSDGNYIVAGNWDNFIYLFHRSSSTPLWNHSFGSSICAVSISSNGDYISAASNMNLLKFFHKSSPTPLWTYNSIGGFTSLSMSSNGEYIAAGVGDGPDEGIFLFENSSSSPLWTNQLGYVSHTKISSNGNYIICVSDKLYLFERTSSTPLWDYSLSGGIYSIDISFDGSYIVLAHYDNYLYLFSKLDSNPIWNYESENIIYTVSISTTGKYFLWGNFDGYLYLFEQDVPPTFFTLYSDKNNPIKDGEFMLYWEESWGATNYSIYTDSDYITEINGGVIKIDEGIEDLTYPFSGLSNGDYYYIIEAHNEIGSVLSNCIHVKVLFPPSLFVLSSNAENPEIDGIFNLLWNTSIWVDNYSVYIHNSYISEVNSSINLLDNDVTEGIYPIQGLSDGDYYFIVVAFNIAGNFTSNCLHIRVGEELSGGGNDFFWIFQAALVGIISAIAGICVKIIYSKLKKKSSS